MSRWAAVVMAVLVAITGCNGADQSCISPTARFAAEMPEGWEEGFYEGLSYWASAGPDVEIMGVGECSTTIDLEDDLDWAAGRASPGTVRIKATAVYAAMMPEDCTRPNQILWPNLVAHEMGHAWGFELGDDVHNPNPDSIMWPYLHKCAPVHASIEELTIMSDMYR